MEKSAFSSRFETRIHRLEVAGRVIDLVAPAEPDALLDEKVVGPQYKADDYLPYWPIIWPSGVMMAEKILREGGPEARGRDTRATGAGKGRVIELGCGLGLAGIAAGLAGWEVLLTDYDAEAVAFALHSAGRNGVPAERVRGMQMDWRACVAEKFDWVIASDVLYEARLQPLVLEAIKQLLAPGGVGWVSDPERACAEDFPILAVEHGFRVKTAAMEGKNSAGGRQGGNLYILSLA